MSSADAKPSASRKRFPTIKHVSHDIATDSVYVLMDSRTPRSPNGMPAVSQIVRTREVHPSVQLDFGPDGELIGVEIL
jgi:uncharacterized protein YuzE